MEQFTHLGFNNWIKISEIDAIQSPKSNPAIRYVQDAKRRHVLVDMSHGRKTKSIIVLKSGTVAISAMAPDTIIRRVIGLNNISSEEKGGE